MLLPQEIISLKERYGCIYSTEILGQQYVWRRLTKVEYEQIDETDCSDEEKEDLACQKCLLYPQDYDYVHGLGGIPTILSAHILIESGFDLERSEQMIDEYRAELTRLEKQMETIIAEVFPQYTLEEIESWDVPMTLKYYTRAEWILVHFKGVPVPKIIEEINSSNDGVIRGDMSDFPELAKAEQPGQRRPQRGR